jgi:hypothetical protein
VRPPVVSVDRKTVHEVGHNEPHWVHGRRRVVEADRLLAAHALADRVCAAFGRPHYDHLAIAEKAA